MALVDNIVAFWKFDEPAPSDYSTLGEYADATGRGNVLVVQPDIRVQAFSSVPFRVGANAGNTQTLDGSVAGWGKWIRLLTSAEKTALMGGEMWPFNTTPTLNNGLVAYYLFNEASNSATYVDATGRGNNLTRTGTTTQVTGPLGVGKGTELVSGAYLEASPIPTDLQTGDSDFTIFGWFNMNSKPGSGQSIFFGQVSLAPNDPIGETVYYQGTSDSINIDIGKGVDLFSLWTSSILSSSPSTSTWYPCLFEFDKVAGTIGGIFNSGTETSSNRNIQPAAVSGIINEAAEFTAPPVYTGTTAPGWGDQIIVRAAAANNPDVYFGNNSKTAWFWFKSNNTSATQTIAGFYDFATNDIDWVVQIAGNTLYFIMGNNSGSFQYCDISFTDTSSFHLLVIWYNKLTNTIHLDLDHSSSTALQILTSVTPSNPTIDFFVGCNKNGTQSAGVPGASQQFLGIIDEMGIANGVPLSTDLDTLWNSGAGWANSFPTLETSDSLTIADSIAALLTPFGLTQLLTDTLTFSDTIVEFLFPSIFALNISDTLILSDSIITKLINTALFLQVSDALQFFDILETSYINRLTLTDFLYEIVDSLSTDIGKAPMGLNDFFNLSDQVQARLDGLASYNDTLVFSDGVEAVLSSSGNPLVDSLVISDGTVQTALSVEIQLLLNDTISLSDAVSQVPSTSFDSYIRRYLNDVPE